MAAGRYLLTIEQGATTDLLLEYKDSNGNVIKKEYIDKSVYKKSEK